MVEYEGDGTIGFDYTLDLTESMTMHDSVFKDEGRTLTETMTLHDARPKMDYTTIKEELIILRDGDAKGINKWLVEAVIFIDTRKHGITTTKTDGIHFLDNAYKGTGKAAFTESMALTDTLLRGPGKLLTETITLTTAFTGTVYISIAHAPSLFVSTNVPSLYTSKTSVPSISVDR